VAFWAVASLLCLATLCWISYQVTTSSEAAAAAGANDVPVALRSAGTEAGTETDSKNVRVECTITTPHSANPNQSDVANGKFHILVRSDAAPKASAAFVGLVRSGYYSGVYFHRVVPNFVAQFGINSTFPAQQRPPRTQDMGPDPVLPSSLSNVRGTVSFAGGNMKLGQVFINLGNNRRLDQDSHDDGSTRPFGIVSQDDMPLVDKIYTGYKEGSGQVKAVKNSDVASQFPEMSRIEECHVVE
jgi:peptidyl-prolyl cis-trans isomerase A (cyclophilin A)